MMVEKMAERLPQHFRDRRDRDVPMYFKARFTTVTVGEYAVDIRPPEGEMWEVLLSGVSMTNGVYGANSVVSTRIWMQHAGDADTLRAPLASESSITPGRPSVTLGSFSDGPIILTNDDYLQLGYRVEIADMSSIAVTTIAIVRRM